MAPLATLATPMSEPPFLSALLKLKQSVSCLFHPIVCLPTGLKLYTQTNASTLPATMPLALYIITRNRSVPQHQVNYFVRKFDGLIRNNLYSSAQRCACSSNLLFAHFNCPMHFTIISIFCHYVTLLYNC